MRPTRNAARPSGGTSAWARRSATTWRSRPSSSSSRRIRKCSLVAPEGPAAAPRRAPRSDYLRTEGVEAPGWGEPLEDHAAHGELVPHWEDSEHSRCMGPSLPQQQRSRRRGKFERCVSSARSSQARTAWCCQPRKKLPGSCSRSAGPAHSSASSFVAGCACRCRSAPATA